MTETTTIEVHPDGKIYRHYSSLEELNISESALVSLADATPRMIGPIFETPFGPINLCLVGKILYPSLTLNQLMLKCPFITTADGVMVPAFQPQGEAPVLSIAWKPVPPIHKDCIIKMMFRANPKPGYLLFDCAWLWARDSRGQDWKLPLANTHAQCNLCTGADAVSAKNVVEGVVRMATNIAESRWNSDLHPDQEKVNALFRFKPTATTFEVQPPLNSNWQQYCEKVSVPTLAYA